MKKSKLSDWISKKYKDGVPLPEIKLVLKDEGYDPELVDRAVKGMTDSPSGKKKKNTSSKNSLKEKLNDLEDEASDKTVSESDDESQRENEKIDRGLEGGNNSQYEKTHPSWFTLVRAIILTPKDLISSLGQSDKTYSIEFAVISFIIFSLLMPLSLLITPFIGQGQSVLSLDLGFVLNSMAVVFVLGVSTYFLSSIINFAFLSVLEDNVDFSYSLGVFSYSAPFLILLWVPWVNLLAIPYLIFMAFLGNKSVIEDSEIEALFVSIIAVGIAVGLTIYLQAFLVSNIPIPFQAYSLKQFAFSFNLF